MFFPTTAARRVYHRGCRLVHPLVDAFLPVTYAGAECRGRIHRLDPTGARGNPEPNTETDGRIISLAATLGIDEPTAQQYLAEARQVRLAEVPPSDVPELASPMCREDRYTTYVVTRIITPKLAVETGIAHGISSAYILSAMEACGAGQLTSIDIDDGPRIGQHVPDSLRSRWRTRHGDSLQVLPDLLALHGPIDMFLHDSNHSYRHMWREFEIVWPHLRGGGLLCAHDIVHNNVFPRFIRKYMHDVGAWTRSVNFGLIRKRSPRIEVRGLRDVCPKRL